MVSRPLYDPSIILYVLTLLNTAYINAFFQYKTVKIGTVSHREVILQVENAVLLRKHEDAAGLQPVDMLRIKASAAIMEKMLPRT